MSSRVSAMLPAIAMGGAALFVALLTALHVIRPDLDPSWTVISAYALGEFGWVMTLALAAMAAGCAALAAELGRHARSRIGRIGLAVLLTSAAGFALAALFPSDPITTRPDRQSVSWQLHSAGAMLGGAIPLAALALTWALTRLPAWTGARAWLWSATAAAWIGDAVFIAAMATMLPRGGGSLGPDVLVGWPNRLMIVTYCAWVFIAAWQASRRPVR